MTLADISPAWRTRLSRFVLLLTIGATIATSDSDWNIGDQEAVPIPPTLPAGGLVVEAEVHYQSPRGAWPLSVRVDLLPSQPGLTVEQEAIFDSGEVKATPDKQTPFEVRCRDKLCEGIITLELRIRAAQAGSGEHFDPALTRSSLQVTAGVYGGPQGDIFGCQRQQSSTDRDDVPSKLLVDVTIDPIDEALYGDAGVPDAGQRGSSALPPLRGLDAGRE